MNATATKPMTKKAQAAQEREEAIARLRKVLKPGDTVHTILRHRARSGMFRVISLVITDKDHNGKPDIRCIDGDVCTVLGYSYNTTHDGIPTGGSGMDMGYHLVYNLSRRLFPDGFGEMAMVEKDGEMLPTGRRPKNKAAVAKMEGVTFRGRNGDTSGWDNDGGYALNHRWL